MEIGSFVLNLHHKILHYNQPHLRHLIITSQINLPTLDSFLPQNRKLRDTLYPYRRLTRNGVKIVNESLQESIQLVRRRSFLSSSLG